MKTTIEYTDTFGGQANYSWCQRATIEHDESISGLALVRRLKAELGINGVPMKRTDMGDCIRLDEVGACRVAFIYPDYTD